MAVTLAAAVAGLVLLRAWAGVDLALAVAGVGLVFVAVVRTWDDGLVVGSSLLLAGYAVSLAGAGADVDLSAPLAAVALLGVVEFGTWSLELRDGAEEAPLARLPMLGLIAGGGLAASAVPLVVANTGFEAGLALWVLGALAGMALLGLIAQLRPTAE